MIKKYVYRANGAKCSLNSIRGNHCSILAIFVLNIKIKLQNEKAKKQLVNRTINHKSFLRALTQAMEMTEYEALACLVKV